MAQPDILNLDQDYKQKYGFYDDIQPVFQTERGLTRRVVEEISHQKNEPKWMREFRLQAYEIFMSKPMPTWGPDLSQLNFDEIVYYIQPTDRKGRSWDEVPEDIKRTFERLGIPEWERKFLAGVGAQYDSEVVYHNLAKQWEEKGVIFVDTDTAVREYPDLVQEYFGTVIPPTDNKFAALNSAVWSGGSFVYVPAGVHVDIPLQAYFRINAKNAGQFERTLIIAEEGSFVHYVEGCLPAGEQVCTESGWVNIESVKPGDFVLDEKGRRVKVRAVMVRPYSGEMIVIRPISPHNTIRLTPEHPVLCVRRERVQSKRRARQPHWKVEVDTPPAAGGAAGVCACRRAARRRLYRLPQAPRNDPRLAFHCRAAPLAGLLPCRRLRLHPSHFEDADGHLHGRRARDRTHPRPHLAD
jgi:Fe-S cluster assembly protein SufB